MQSLLGGYNNMIEMCHMYMYIYLDVYACVNHRPVLLLAHCEELIALQEHMAPSRNLVFYD
jgi:hypothetical protein